MTVYIVTIRSKLTGCTEEKYVRAINSLHAGRVAREGLIGWYVVSVRRF